MPDKQRLAITDPRHFLAKYLAEEFRGWEAVGSCRGDVVVHFADSPAPAEPLQGPKVVVVVPPGHDVPQLRMPGQPTVTVVRTAHVVGTGMTGLPMRMAAAIGRSLYSHVAGDESRISVVHALDVARLVRRLAPLGGEWTVSDGQDPTVSDFAEALSMRLGHKRVTTMSPHKAWWAAWATSLIGGLSRAQEKRLRQGDTVEPTPLPFDFTPIHVVDYLKTHQYGPEDI